MSIQKSEAIVLKVSNFRETSLIVSLFTKDFGKISGLIKGIRNEPQRYGGLPLIFSQSFIVFYAKPKRELNLVTQCDAQEQFLAIRSDLKKTNYANYFLELLDAVTEDYDKNERLFALALDALKALGANDDCNQTARTFEIKLLDVCGFKPRLDGCVHCQGKMTAEAKFSSRLGGILCRRCLSFDQDARSVLKGSLASIDYIEKASWLKALRLKMNPRVSQELLSILNSFLAVHLNKEIKSRKFLI